MLFNKGMVMFYITVVFIFKTSNGNRAEVLGFVGNSFDTCVKSMHDKMRDYAQKGNPVINHTIVDIMRKD